MLALIYFSDVSQLVNHDIKKIACNKNNRLITNDMAVAFQFDMLGIEYIDEWTFLNETDIEKNKETAHHLAKNWWNEAFYSTAYNGFPLSDIVQQDLVYSFEACLNARVVYKRLFEAYSVHKISGYFVPSVPVIRTGPSPAIKAVQSVTQAILFYMAENHGIQIERLNAISNGFSATNL